MGDTTRWSHETVLAADAASASKARAFVCSHLAEHHLSHLAEDVRLVASELATNAVQHAGTPFTLIIEKDGPAVVLTVRDAAPAAPVRLPSRPLMDIGGRGLAIVEQVSQAWGVTAGPNRVKSVWASFGT